MAAARSIAPAMCGVPASNLCGSSPIEEHEQSLRQGIFLEDVLHQADQSIKALPHVDRLAVGQDPAPLRGQEHVSAPKQQSGPVGQRHLDLPRFANLGDRWRNLDEPCESDGPELPLPATKAARDQALSPAELRPAQVAVCKATENLGPLRFRAPNSSIARDLHPLLLDARAAGESGGRLLVADGDKQRKNAES
jgi:hypothetical protein